MLSRGSKILSYLLRILLAVISSVGLYVLIFIVLAVKVLPNFVLSSLVNETTISVLVGVLVLLTIRQAYVIYLEDKELKNTEMMANALEQQRDYQIFEKSMQNYYCSNESIREIAKLHLQKLKAKGKFVDEVDRILS